MVNDPAMNGWMDGDWPVVCTLRRLLVRTLGTMYSMSVLGR